MTGKIFGVPLVLILLAGGISAMVNVPMYFMHQAQMEKMNKIEIIHTEAVLKANPTPTIVIVTATPTPTPVKKITPSTIKRITPQPTVEKTE